jgi:short subunit dehydrogenase-like uncharacterized protein
LNAATVTRDFDLVIFGASGFVGRLLTEQLAKRTAETGLRWAIAGRSEQRLEALRTELGLVALPIVLASAEDRESLDRLAARSRVICSTVGPYALHGSGLVAACAEAGTHYCDITGEVQWIREMLDRHEQTARESGARLVHCCGFDSIPSDLGCLVLQETAIGRFGAACDEVHFLLRNARGGFSGGTIASLLNLVEAAREDRALRRQLADPYSLCLPDPSRRSAPPDQSGVRYDDQAQSWTAPFLMGPVNSRIVYRSNQLLDGLYGDEFRYGECVITGRGLRGRASAIVLATGLKLFVAAAAIKPLRRFMQNRFLPAPGEGPTAAEREAGFFDIRFVGLKSGQRIDTRVTGDRDPGYGATSLMLAECALGLAEGRVRDGLGGGSFTPASCFGTALIEPLETHAGMRFSVDA